MPGEYITAPYRLADMDEEFWVWVPGTESGMWTTKECNEHGCSHGSKISIGGTIISYVAPEGYTEWAIDDRDTPFLCIEHFMDLVRTFSPKETKDAVTLALFEHGVSPDVIADILSQLDLDERMKSIIPDFAVKEA